ncbi:hypothetical protein [Evansella tamaricis]|uniref:DUF4367 domain-containing protein n=1 Tax=Evansella tamaricis TaxID=2069301 RepID=A0ABS6JN37_9BACI|nr:hypothetical protein [Evansella tamaricis]MBU9714609.1 hypothetical protein [Evansella tamaricis]
MRNCRNLKQITFFILSSIIVSFIAACQTEDSLEQNEILSEYIHMDFGYSSFSYPQTWDVVSIAKDVYLRYQDWENPENHRYSQVPYRYKFDFGKKAPENEVGEKQIEDFNDQQALQGETYRQLYYHTYFQHYATLEISKNGFTRLISNDEHMEEWNINGEEFRVLRQGNEWIINWYKNGAYFDLIILGEAGITTDEQSKELIETLFLH